MIAIINTGEIDEVGRSLYRLQINDALIAEFYHHRIDGLGACLALAACAADRAHFDKINGVLKLAEEKPDVL
jgi:hypothetical protein